jgi:hypothetical protein
MFLGKRTRRWLAPALVGVTVMAGGLAACSDDDDSASDDVGLVPADDPGTEADDSGTETDGSTDASAQSLTGTWEGTYECAAGQAGLTLTVDDDRGDDEVAANFEYHPPDGATGATGRYSMEGTVTDGQLALTGLEWIEPREGGDQPMVGLEAAVADRSDTEHLEGTVVGEGCTSFAVDRVSTEPWYVGAWSGTYGCSQGITGLTLTIEDLGDRAVEATYDFYAVPENPGVPSGSYRMEGNYVDGEMVLTGVEWIDQPPGYAMVDLRIWSDLGIDPRRLYGTVRLSGGGESGCSLFTLEPAAT